MNFEEMKTEDLMKELREIASLAFPGDVAKQNATKIVTILRGRKRERRNKMVISNIWATAQYKEKIEKMFECFDVFEVASFFEKHSFRSVEDQTEVNTNDHDIVIVNEIGWDVFNEHLPNYFNLKEERK